MFVHILLLASFAVGAARAQTATAPETPAGHYRLVYAEWPDSLRHLPNPNRLPDRLELTAVPFTVERRRPDGTVERFTPPGLEGARVVRYPGLPEGAGPFSYWWIESGSLLLSGYLSMAGFHLRLEPSGDDWEGTLTGSTDAIPEDGNASAHVSARLVREPWPAR